MKVNSFRLAAAFALTAAILFSPFILIFPVYLLIVAVCFLKSFVKLSIYNFWAGESKSKKLCANRMFFVFSIKELAMFVVLFFPILFGAFSFIVIWLIVGFALIRKFMLSHWIIGDLNKKPSLKANHEKLAGLIATYDLYSYGIFILPSLIVAGPFLLWQVPPGNFFPNFIFFLLVPILFLFVLALRWVFNYVYFLIFLKMNSWLKTKGM